MKMKKTIAIIIIVFVAVLLGSIGIQLFTSPDFHGFSKATPGEPVVTYLPSDSGNASGSGAADASAYNWKDHPVFIVGDSLTQGARPAILAAVGDATIDAKVSRNMATGVTILKGWADSGILTDDAIIIVCLANNITNSTVQDAQQIVDMIKPGQSLIMMTGHGLSNMDPANEFIRSLPGKYSYITVADWDLTIAQSPSLLGDDGIHVSKSQGNDLYASLILKALEVTRPMS